MNKNTQRKPNKECSVSKLADTLLNMEAEVELNFSQNSDGSDYWGAKRLNLFDGDIIIFGYYGSYSYKIYVPQVETEVSLLQKLEYQLGLNQNEVVFLFENQN